MITFSRRKQDTLKKNDKSSIGEIDEPIAELCKRINLDERFYTLSSCSGRIVLIRNLEKKQPGMFVFRTHGKVGFEELKKSLADVSKRKVKDSLIFKQEPPILHICCAELGDAEEMLDKSRACGWKNSGIMSTRGRIVLELRSTEYLALPIMEKGKILVDEGFLKVLVAESNNRLLRGWEKIKKFERNL